MLPFEYYYMSEVSDKQVHKWHKKDANRRSRRINKQEDKELREEDYHGKVYIVTRG